jgi:hypothetical protein
MLNRNARALIIRHMLGFHWKGRWWGVCLAEVADKMKIFAEGWVITQIGVKPGPKIGINEVVVYSMNDIHVPTHKVHLKAKDSLMGSVVGKDKFDSIAVSDPHKSMTVTHMAYFVHSPVPTKAFTEVGMNMLFIPPGTPGAKRDGVQHTNI